MPTLHARSRFASSSRPFSTSTSTWAGCPRMPRARSPPPRVPRAGLVGLAALAGIGFSMLLQPAYQRMADAMSEAPSVLALTYLRLAVNEHPTDRNLKLRLAESALALGNLEEAATALT